jgi:hypothetical protein
VEACGPEFDFSQLIPPTSEPIVKLCGTMS